MSSVKEINESQWDGEVKNSDIPVLVDFWAPWCGPCRMVSPVVEELGKKHEAKLKTVKLNTDENPSIAQKYGIRAIPTLILLQKGEEIGRFVGYQPLEQLENQVLSHLEGGN
ncbi:MAG: thioredoxin [Acidobacteria bacterium]|nr:thioredoxin [Acidobacteriota bacterium]